MKLVKITKDGDELTRHGFVSHLESYLQQLLSDPLHASIGDYLMSHGLSNEELLPILLKQTDKNDENSAILIRKEKIRTNPETGKDSFIIKYQRPKKDQDKKLRNLFINLFENYQTNNTMLNEEGEGATSCCSMTPQCNAIGDVTIPFTTKNGKKKKDTSIIRREFPTTVSEGKKKKLILGEYQLERLKESVVNDTPIGDFGYDAPASVCDKNDPTMKRHNGKGGSISVNHIK